METERLWEIIEEECAVLQNRLHDHQERAGRFEPDMHKSTFPANPKDEFLIECLARFEAGKEINIDLAEKAVAHFQKLVDENPVHAKDINVQMKRRANDYGVFDGRVFFKLMLRKPEWPEKKMHAIFCPLSVIDGMVRPVRNSGLEAKGAMSIYLQANGRTDGGTGQLNLTGSADEKPFVMSQECKFAGLIRVKIQGVMGEPGSSQKNFLHTDQTLLINEEDLTPPLKRKSRRAKPRRDLKKAV